MWILRIVIIFMLFSLTNCVPSNEETELDLNRLSKGALLTTSFKSYEDFKKVVSVEYSSEGSPWVKLTHHSPSGQIISKLETGVSEDDFLNAKTGGVWDKVTLAFASPYFVMNREDLLRVFFLSRRRHKDFGWPDKAFFDLAESMKNNIDKEDLAKASDDDKSEKGYLNTFNHIIAQALMTSLFSEKLADFVADTHERKNMPELITGDFSAAQLEDIKNGVVDNYVDIINNEWGQELGKKLTQKYNIDRNTIWTPELLANYLNEIQSYFSRVFKIRFEPFTPTEEISIHFSEKMNLIMNDVSGMW